MSEFTFSFAGLGSHFWFFIYDKLDSKHLAKIEKRLKNEVSEFENKYSRFIKTSLISKLNESKKLSNFPKELFEILSICQQTKTVSGGSFDIFVGSVLENLGYDSQYSFQSKNTDLNQINKTGFITFSKDFLEITKESKIDLGGIGKGYLIDKLAKILQVEFNLKFFTINGGGDVFSTGKPDQADEVILENPKDKTEGIGRISLKNQAIASSGQNKRNWTDPKTKQKYGHLIPLLGKNDAELEAVWTVGKTALQTDLSATCFFVSEPKYFPKIKEFFEVSFLFLFKDGSYLKDPGFRGEVWG